MHKCEYCGQSVDKVAEIFEEKVSGFVNICKECADKRRQPAEVYSRVCGYFRPVKTWNDSKQQEFEDRTTFRVNYEA